MSWEQNQIVQDAVASGRRRERARIRNMIKDLIAHYDELQYLEEITALKKLDAMIVGSAMGKKTRLKKTNKKEAK